MTKRIFKFLHQLIIRVPISAIINFFAISPIAMGYAYFVEGTGVSSHTDTSGIIVFIFSFFFMVVGFRLNKWRYNRKGKQTDYSFEREYEEIRYEIRAEYNNWTDQIDVTSHEMGRNNYTRTEWASTQWGKIAAITSFIALPCQLIALAFSFLGIFFKFIYTSTKTIPYDLGGFNKMTHILFDFVIIKP
ncbi:MAG: hypothetical protein IKA43_07425 [Clostridia bacterium]|nr:hypothetical protein [Clostridia bacterium]